MAAAFGLFGCVLAGAQEAAVPSPKERFVGQLLGEGSQLVRRIEAGGDPAARALLEAAIDQFRRAQSHLREGRLAEGDAALNEAIWNVGRARQLAPDPTQDRVAERVKYARLLAGVESLLAAYRRGLAESGRADAGADAVAERANALLEDARTLANAESLQEANRVLEAAEHGLLPALSRMLGQRTLRYTQTFESPDEEFAWEVRRNASYAELVPVALHEYRPSAEQIVAVGRRVERNQALREQAQRDAARRDWRAALRTIRAGTQELQRALSAAGLVVPSGD